MKAIHLPRPLYVAAVLTVFTTIVISKNLWAQDDDIPHPAGPDAIDCELALLAIQDVPFKPHMLYYGKNVVVGVALPDQMSRQAGVFISDRSFEGPITTWWITVYDRPVPDQFTFRGHAVMPDSENPQVDHLIDFTLILRQVPGPNGGRDLQLASLVAEEEGGVKVTLEKDIRGVIVPEGLFGREKMEFQASSRTDGLFVAPTHLQRGPESNLHYYYDEIADLAVDHPFAGRQTLDADDAGTDNVDSLQPPKKKGPTLH